MSSHQATFFDRNLALQKAHAAHMRGALGVAEKGYADVLAHNPAHADAQHLLGFLLQQAGRAPQALRHTEAAVRLNPQSADYHATHGLVLQTLGRTDEALGAYDSALALDPGHIDALNRRGIALLELSRAQEALETFDSLLALMPSHAEARGNRGNALVALNRPEEAVNDYDTMRSLEGDSPRLLTNRGHALRRLDRLDDARTDLTQALALDAHYAEAAFELGMTELALGLYDKGWANYEHRFATRAFAPWRRDFSAPQWTGAQSPEGRTILLHAEQGFGDTIQFARYAPLVAQRGATVLLEVQPELVGLMAGLAGVDRVIARGEKISPFDLHCPLMSLPRAFGTEEGNVPSSAPYLATDKTLVAAWRARLPQKGKRIGLCWAGKPAHRNDANRSLALSNLVPLFDTPDATFVSLQYAPRPADRALLQRHDNVVDVSDEIGTFPQLAALIGALDLVVTVDTSIAHLSGALGKPTITLLPYAADFRWLREREDSPWYPTMRLMRQPRFGDWPTVMARLFAELAKT